MKKKILFLFNPYSGKGKIKENLADIVDIMVKAGYEVTVYTTQCQGDAVHKAREEAGNYDRIVCSGGDGTLDEVVTGVMSAAVTFCIMFVYIGTYAAGMDRLLEEGDYTRSSKARSHITGKVSTIYWLAVTAIFLFYTFGPNGNGQAQYSWFIWAIAGVLYGAMIAIVKLVNRAGK